VISNQTQDSLYIRFYRPGYEYYSGIISALTTNVTINITTDKDNGCEDEIFTLIDLSDVSDLVCSIVYPNSATVTVEDDDSE